MSCKSGFGANIWKSSAVMRQGAGYLAYLTMLIKIQGGATKVTKEATTKSGIRAINYVRNIIFMSLISITKATRKSTRLTVNRGNGMKMKSLRKALLRKSGFNLILIE